MPFKLKVPDSLAKMITDLTPKTSVGQKTKEKPEPKVYKTRGKKIIIYPPHIPRDRIVTPPKESGFSQEWVYNRYNQIKQELKTEQDPARRRALEKELYEYNKIFSEIKKPKTIKKRTVKLPHKPIITPEMRKERKNLIPSIWTNFSTKGKILIKEEKPLTGFKPGTKPEPKRLAPVYERAGISTKEYKRTYQLKNGGYMIEERKIENGNIIHKKRFLNPDGTPVTPKDFNSPIEYRKFIKRMGSPYARPKYKSRRK